MNQFFLLVKHLDFGYWKVGPDYKLNIGLLQSTDQGSITLLDTTWQYANEGKWNDDDPTIQIYGKSEREIYNQRCFIF